jgi:mannan endo-1,4-beta-mannosidase
MKVGDIMNPKRSVCTSFCLTLVSTVLLLPGTHARGGQTEGFRHFVTRKVDRLYDGDREYRFISFNIPCLHYIEDDMQFERTMPFRLPDPFEIEDALKTVKQMGGQAARTYTLSVRRKADWDTRPVHVLGPGQFNEEAFVALDQVLALANKHQVRLIIPFVNNFQWWGGAQEYAAFRNKRTEDFWTDPQLIADLKQTIAYVINRINTITGVPYKEDKAILAWETANESHCPHSWTAEICKYVKSLDRNHLVVDGYHTGLLRQETIDDPHIDFVQSHHYEKDPIKIIPRIKANIARTRGKKPYHVGEFGFLTTEATRAVLQTVIDEGLSGALIWSLRRHYKDGGFLWHTEPDGGGEFYKAYHWPGFATGQAYDETALMALMREKAFEIQGVPLPPVPVPDAPHLLPIKTVGAISWRGSVGASGYRIERGPAANGPWQIIVSRVSDDQVQYRPLFNDRTATIGSRYYYRIRAQNDTGVSEPSNVVGPVQVDHLTLVDELANDGLMFLHSKTIRFKHDVARIFKEDCHRVAGTPGTMILYYVPQTMTAWRVFAFASEQGTDFDVAVSTDGKAFKQITPQRTQYAGSSKNLYGYWIPILYQGDNTDADVQYLKLTFKSKAQISRVEIDYGN